MRLILLLFLFVCLVFPYAQETNEDLRQRIESLEKELQELKESVKSQPAEASEESEEVVDESTAEAAKEEAKEKKVDGIELFNVKSKLAAKIYGYIKLDMSYDTARTDVGNFARWVESEALVKEDDDQFNATARQTRLGLELTGPDIYDDIQTSGKIEIDFYGGGSENSNLVRIRHAFMKIHWKKHDLSILAGQTWDVIFTTYPKTVNFPPLWWSGNIGFRRPQIRLSKGFALDGDAKIGIDIAAARTIGSENKINGVAVDTGEDSGYPTGQGRIYYTAPMAGKKMTNSQNSTFFTVIFVMLYVCWRLTCLGIAA